MAKTIDQIFVLLTHWIEGFFPPAWRAVIGVVIGVAAIVVVFA
jgi:hypothetical protein